MSNFTLFLIISDGFYVPVITLNDYMFSRFVDYCCVHQIDHIFAHFRSLKAMEHYISGVMKRHE